MSHYQTLDIERDATPEQIKAAYRKLASAHHPDKGGNHNDFVAIQLAYEVLIDEFKRAAYDLFGDAGDVLTTQAEQVIAQMFLNLVEVNNNLENDFIGAIRSDILRQIDRLRGNCLMAWATLRKLRKVSAKLTKTSPTSIVLTQLRQSAIRAAQQLTQQRQQREIAKRVIQLLDSYEYEFTPAPPAFVPQRTNVWFGYGTTT